MMAWITLQLDGRSILYRDPGLEELPGLMTLVERYVEINPGTYGVPVGVLPSHIDPEPIIRATIAARKVVRLDSGQYKGALMSRFDLELAESVASLVSELEGITQTGVLSVKLDPGRAWTDEDRQRGEPTSHFMRLSVPRSGKSRDSDVVKLTQQSIELAIKLGMVHSVQGRLYSGPKPP